MRLTQKERQSLETRMLGLISRAELVLDRLGWDEEGEEVLSSLELLNEEIKSVQNIGEEQCQ